MKIINGDCMTELKKLPEKSINMCMTSPPYWALRDYGEDKQLGLEPTFDEYINKLCNVFDEVKRVLRDDGTCWVNIGDTYSGSGAGQKNTGVSSLPPSGFRNKPTKTNYSDKCLLGIPMRFALEMINRGWILRNVIIWHKPNCMPSSVKDRFTIDFEYIFFFSKKKKYYFEQQLEPSQYKDSKGNVSDKARLQRANAGWKPGKDYPVQANVPQAIDNVGDRYCPAMRNKRTVWTINPKPFKEAHFAVYPEELCETPIKAGCPEGGIVLDPFFGAGTTGLVALKQNKNFIGIELNPDYIKIAEARLKPFMEQEKLKEDKK